MKKNPFRCACRSGSIFLMACTLAMASAQMPEAITIDPPNATAYDELTLIFDPALACVQSGSLAGLPYIAIHSGVTFYNGNAWQNVINFDSHGFNGQATTLMPTGDGRFSITYVPADYYGLNSQVVTQICAVFNNGTDWTQDGRDFDDYGYCMDFYIPLNYSPSQFCFMVNMNKMIADGSFDPSTDNVFAWIDQPAEIQLSDAEQDGIYEGTYCGDLEIGETYVSKFRINEDEYETIARTTLAIQGVSYITGWWNDEPDPESFMTLVDFEDGTSGPLNLHVMGCGEYDFDYLHLVSETFDIVDNPDPSDLNPSAKVMKFNRWGTLYGAQTWGGFWANCVPRLDITFMKYVHVKIWKPRITPLRFKLEGGFSGTQEIENSNPQTLVNEWEEVVFDFSTMTREYPIIAFMPDYENPLTVTDHIEIYFDDIVINTIPYPIYVGMKEPVESRVRIYPNPVEEILTVSSDNVIEFLVGYDLMSREVLREYDLPAGNSNVSLTNLKPGIYFLSLEDDNGLRFCRKIVKK